MILRVRDAEGNVQEILAIKGEKGEKGDPYILTETDKAEIVNAVLSSMPSVEDIIAKLPDGDEVDY